MFSAKRQALTFLPTTAEENGNPKDEAGNQPTTKKRDGKSAKATQCARFPHRIKPVQRSTSPISPALGVAQTTAWRVRLADKTAAQANHLALVINPQEAML